jgi:hypothetical protein
VGAGLRNARTSEGFADAYVDEGGHTVAGPGEVDLAPDTLYLRVTTGAWPPVFD